jgi:CBS domain-containing protein
MSHTNPFAADAALAKLEAKVDAIRQQRPPVVAEIMTKDIATCGPHDVVENCAQMMWDRACGSIPVVDADGRPISIITDRDICMAAWIQGKPLWAIVVASAMSRRLFTVNVLEPVSTAEAIMRRHGIRRLPVVDDAGRLVGILSVDDIARHGQRAPFVVKDALSAPAIADTAAAVGYAPR